MTLQVSGPISASNINTELTLGTTATLGLNDTVVRTLANKLSGTISYADLYGKAKAVAGSTFISGYATEPYWGMALYGWNTVGIDALPIIGSASTTPMSMAPYSGSLYGLFWWQAYQFVECFAIGAPSSFYVTINSTRFLMSYGGVNGSYTYFYSDFNTPFASPPFYTDSRNNIVTFG